MVLYSFNDLFYQSFGLLVSTAIFWVPPALVVVLWLMYTHYIRETFWSKRNWILLEVRLPKIIAKTPQAMELVLNAFNQKYDGNMYQQIMEGFQRTFFSLEIVSLEGKLHFFIRTDRFFKPVIEAQLYSQFPDAEMFEVEDYMLSFTYHGDDEYKLWGSETELSKDDIYPIKTYIDYKLDKPGTEEEEKIDPLALVVEALGSIGPGENAFMQIVIRGAKDKIKHAGLFKKEKVEWKKEGLKAVNEMMKRDAPKDEALNFAKFQLSPGEKEGIESIERSLSKPPFDTGIRLLYIAKKENHSALTENLLRNLLVPFNSSLNSFKGSNPTGFTFPWQDPFKTRTQKKKKIMFDAYRKRSFFYPPYVRKYFILSAEELATIFHFPGGVVTTPTLGRIESKRVEPPANLPL